MTKRICYAINDIAVKNQSQLICQKQSKQVYKRLMTSLSHNVKTPLASLVGYLEAVTAGFVAGDEKEAYIHVAVEKAYHLKNFVETLFEWVKLDAKEQIFHFEICDINELTRNSGCYCIVRQLYDLPGGTGRYSEITAACASR